jgi:uncharacterized membrane protein
VSNIQQSIDVDVPIGPVYNQWTQFEEFPEFMEGVEQVRQIDDSTTEWTAEVAGHKRTFKADIVEQSPEERVAWKSTEGAPHAGVVTFHKLADDETRVTVQLDWQPDGIVEKAGAVVGVDDHQVSSDLDRFKSFIEGRGQETGAWRGEVPREG